VKPIRRIITGHNTAGNSVFRQDDNSSPTVTSGVTITNLWQSAKVPVDNVTDYFDGFATIEPPETGAISDLSNSRPLLPSICTGQRHWTTSWCSKERFGQSSTLRKDCCDSTTHLSSEAPCTTGRTVRTNPPCFSSCFSTQKRCQNCRLTFPACRRSESLRSSELILMRSTAGRLRAESLRCRVRKCSTSKHFSANTHSTAHTASVDASPDPTLDDHRRAHAPNAQTAPLPASLCRGPRYACGGRDGRPARPEQTALRGHGLDRFQKEGLVTDLSTGRSWRLAADEGTYLGGTDLAPAR